MTNNQNTIDSGHLFYNYQLFGKSRSTIHVNILVSYSLEEITGRGLDDLHVYSFFSFHFVFY
jgi:hypothetical protein